MGKVYSINVSVSQYGEIVAVNASNEYGVPLCVGGIKGTTPEAICDRIVEAIEAIVSEHIE